MYNIEYHPLFEDDLKTLGHSVVIKVLKKIEKIAQNPTIVGKSYQISKIN